MFHFPFGQSLHRVIQTDISPKKVFILGVYASAVHARWINNKGKELIKALAVASEPEIFWEGKDAREIISKIQIHSDLGQLLPPSASSLNGPSGRALDKHYLEPLGIDRKDAWLCDLLPESRVNDRQRIAINKYYTKEIINQYGLTPATIPNFDEKEIGENASQRHLEIFNELKSSNAETIILLGDFPVKWFLHFFDKRFKRLIDFQNKCGSYGKPCEIKICDTFFNVIALCHPRNAAKLGTFSSTWSDLHKAWKPGKII